MNTSQVYTKMALNYQWQLSELSPGYRFQPSDQELIEYYLKRRVEGFPPDVIPEANVYDVEPFNLDGARTVDGELKGLYVLTKTKKRYPGGKRVNREAGNGNWRVINKETPIEDSQGKTIGFKRYLVYRCREPSRSEKNWHMNEYRLSSQQQSSGNEEWVLCKITRGKLAPDSGRDTTEVKDIDEAEEITTTTNGDDAQNEVRPLLGSEGEPWDNNLPVSTDQYQTVSDFFPDIPMNGDDWLNEVRQLLGSEGEPWDNNLPLPTDQYQSVSDFLPDIPMNDGRSYQTAPPDTTGYIDGFGDFYWTSSTLPSPPPSSGPSMDWYHEASYPQPDKDFFLEENLF